MVIALIAAILGFTGVLQNADGIVQFVFYLVVGFCGLSLLFGLFEESEARATRGKTARVRLSDS